MMKSFNVKRRNDQAGFTLIEVMLVLAVAAIILVGSIQQYQMFRSDKDIQQVLYNVNMLAQGMSYYYWANCRGTINPTTNLITPGTLSPYYTPPPIPGTPIVLNLNNDLIKTGYLPNTLFLPGNPYATAYVIQFNESLIPQSRTGCDDAQCTTSSPKQIGTLVSYKMQISVQLTDTTKAQAVKGLLGADCLSSAGATGVLPCASAPANANTYAVFERAPANPTPSSPSALMQNQANLQIFIQQQTTESLTSLMSTNHTPEYEYFLCSGY